MHQSAIQFDLFTACPFESVYAPPKGENVEASAVTAPADTGLRAVRPYRLAGDYVTGASGTFGLRGEFVLDFSSHGSLDATWAIPRGGVRSAFVEHDSEYLGCHACHRPGH